MINNKTQAVLISVFIAVFFIQACVKREPAEPPVPANFTPVATVFVDDFEDGDIINSISPMDPINNYWSGFWDNHSAITTGLLTAPGGEYGATCFGASSNLVSAISVPFSGFYGFNGMFTYTYTNFGTKTGVYLKFNSVVSFSMNVNVVDPPTNGDFKYGLALYNTKTGYYVQYDYTAAVSTGVWKKYRVLFSDFTLPAGAGYTAGQVFSNVTELDFYYFLVSPSQNTAGRLDVQVDNISFEKF